MNRFKSLNRYPWYVLYVAGIGDVLLVGGILSLIYWLVA
jgi:hypothetical protein